MSDRVIDCCGLSCPEPVLRVRRALQESSARELQVRVNTAAARDNVSRTARSLGWQAEVNVEDDCFLLTLNRK